MAGHQPRPARHGAATSAAHSQGLGAPMEVMAQERGSLQAGLVVLSTAPAGPKLAVRLLLIVAGRSIEMTPPVVGGRAAAAQRPVRRQGAC